MKKKSRIHTSDLHEVDIEILEKGVKITNKDINKIMLWNEITGVHLGFNIIQWSSVLNVRIKRNELNQFFPAHKNRIDLVKMRRLIVSNRTRFKKGRDIVKYKIEKPLKMITKTSVEK